MHSQQPTTQRPLLWRVLPPVLFVFLVLVVYADPLLTGRTFVGRDLLPYGYPLEKEVHDAWARGRVPTWSAEISGGRPLFPNPNAGALYPIRPLLSLLQFPLAMRLFPIFHWALAGIGTILLLRALRASRAAECVGAATYAFSGVIVSEVFYLPLLAAAALQPWALWALVRPEESLRRKAVPLGLIYGLMLLAGDIVAVSIALLAAVLWIGLEVAGPARARELSVLGLGLLLAGLLAAPQIVATMLFAPETQRAVVGMKLDEALTFALSPWRFFELAVPYPFGNTWSFDPSMNWGRGVFRCFFATLYCGAFSCVALAVTWRAKDRGLRFSRTLFLVSALLAVAGAFVPAAWTRLRSPLPLRYPEKLAVALVLSLAVATGLAFDRFRDPAHRSVLVLGVAMLLTILAAGASLFPASAGALATAAVAAAPGLSREAGGQIAGSLAEGGLLWIVTFIALELVRRAGSASQAAAVLLLAAVPIAASRRIAQSAHDGSVFPPTAFARAIERRDPGTIYRTVDESLYRPPSVLQALSHRGDPGGSAYYRQSWFFHTQSLWERGTVFNSDLDAADLSRVESLRRISSWAAGQPDAAPFFSSVALRFGIRFRDQQPLAGFRRFGGDAVQDWDENGAAKPEIRLLERWREEPGSLAALGSLPRLSAEEVVLETGRRASGAAQSGVLRVIEKNPERLVLETSTTAPAWVFVLRGFWSHRTVRVDGREVSCVPAQLAYSAIPVPQGAHRIDWREEIPGFSVSRWGPVLFAAIAGLLVRRTARRRGNAG